MNCEVVEVGCVCGDCVCLDLKLDSVCWVSRPGL